MKKLLNNNFKAEELLLYLERNKKFKKIDKNVLLNLALRFTNYSFRTKDWRYLNLALKIRDEIPRNITLNSKIDKLINHIKKFK